MWAIVKKENIQQIFKFTYFQYSADKNKIYFSLQGHQIDEVKLEEVIKITDKRTALQEIKNILLDQKI